MFKKNILLMFIKDTLVKDKSMIRVSLLPFLLSLFLLVSCVKIPDHVITVNKNLSRDIFSDYMQVENILPVCDGWANGFLEGNSTLIYTVKENYYFLVKALEFDRDLSVTSNNNILSGDSQGLPYVEISPISDILIVKNNLITPSVSYNKNLYVPATSSDMNPNFFSYSFCEGSEAINIDLQYYTNLLLDDATDFFGFVSDPYFEIIKEYFLTENFPIKNFAPITAHALSFSSQKYYFLSAAGQAINTSSTFWCYDFYEKKLNKIDDNVKTFNISNDRNFISYVKKNGSRDDLFVLDVSKGFSGNKAVNIFSSYEISGIKWSPTGAWIAASAGESSRNDIYMISHDGSTFEQLTHGLHATGEIFFSNDGTKVAFNTLRSPGLVQNPTIYLMSLQIKSQFPSPSATPKGDSSARDIFEKQIYSAFQRATVDIQLINNLRE